MPVPITPLNGQRFGRLTVVMMDPSRVTAKGKREIYWKCSCECGETVSIRSNTLRGGRAKSCGCLARELSGNRLRATVRKHGETAEKRTPEYIAWRAMLQRCYYPNANNYYLYGGRGIAVCDRWRESYEAFLADMGRKPSLQHSLERDDPDKNYEPGNCRWATKAEQSRNRRNTIWVLVNGEKVSLAAACEELGLPYLSIYHRINRGADFETAVARYYRKHSTRV